VRIEWEGVAARGEDARGRRGGGGVAK
jgi:hypothetical protein